MNVKLSELIDGLEMVSSDSSIIYNTESGEFIYFYEFDSDYDEEDFYGDEYIYLPSQYDINEVTIMEEFAQGLEKVNMRNGLLGCLHRKGMYRMFKDKLYDYGIQEKYFEFYREKLKEIAIVWCNENNLKYEEKEEMPNK